MTQVIDSFKGEYFFLSNFYPSPMNCGGTIVQTVEHGYQAAKAKTEEEAQWVLASSSAGEAKKRGRKVELKEEWEDIKVSTMIVMLLEKFRQHPDLYKKLQDTGDAELIEGNWWGDTYWGVCKGVGENMLGKCLMSIRTGPL